MPWNERDTGEEEGAYCSREGEAAGVMRLGRKVPHLNRKEKPNGGLRGVVVAKQEANRQKRNQFLCCIIYNHRRKGTGAITLEPKQQHKTNYRARGNHHTLFFGVIVYGN